MDRKKTFYDPCCNQVPFYKCSGTSGIVLLTVLVFLTASSVSSFRSRLGRCPNCSGRYIKIISAVTSRCVVCWPCIDCNHGSGSSVPCKSTITVGTKIHCVECVEGQTFSDSSGLDQCQPCGVCSGKHEHVFSKCTLESDVKCDCEAGFYRNQTTNECLPSVGSGGIKSLFTLLPTSSLVTSSYSHATATPLPPGITKSAPVPSRTQQIRAASTSASGLVKHVMTPTVHVQKTMHMNTDNTHGSSKMKPGMIVVIVLLSIGYLLISVCLCKSRTCQVNHDSTSDDEQGRPLVMEESNSRKSSGVSELDAHKISGEKVDSVPGSEDMCRTVDLAHQDGGIETNTSSDQPDSRIEAAQKGISSSLEDEPRKNITKGHQSSDFLEADQDESVSVDGTIVPSDNLDPTGVLPNKMPSANTYNVFLTLNPLFDSSQIQRGTDVSEPFTKLPSWVYVGTTPEVFQPHTTVSWPQSLMDNERNGPITDGMGQGRPVSWSTLTHREKYNTKVLEMPFPVLYKICLSLDIWRADGNDVRMLAHKLGVSVSEFALLKQAVINTQNPNNSISHAVLDKKPSGTVGDFVDIMKDIGRDDIVSVINNITDPNLISMNS
ncbi:hypothetical protein OS493_005871 [Desmophyllum pertusum]|uniref:TNFR-Cys domain-containing protein n=1 Tax=Desmophyllum pertusum TaxID=174260 RepID=A0A9X0CHV9_9CNID|nr:hypothetical protein OS493_005871 [Desmophyllum pertusum]